MRHKKINYAFNLFAFLVPISLMAISAKCKNEKVPSVHDNTKPEIKKEFKYNNSINYYASLEGKKGKELYDAIFDLQSKYKKGIGSYSDLYKIYKTAFIDKYFEKDETILDVYSENPDGKDPYEFKDDEYDGQGGKPRLGANKNAEGYMYNREHVIPQSWFNKQTPTRHDPHFIWPTDKMVNQWRGNLPHFNVLNASKISKNGTKINSSYCEPIDYFKGDFARAYFYFQGTHRNGYETANAKKVFGNKGVFPYFNKEFLDCYLEWSTKDPVDIIEVDRNNEIAKQCQGLRNPFIDYPNLTKLIFDTENTETFHNLGVLEYLE